MGIQNAEFDADFEYVKKLQKTHAKKAIYEKVTRKMEFLTYVTVCKNLRPMPFLGELFAFLGAYLIRKQKTWSFYTC